MDSPTMPGSHIVIILKLTSPAGKDTCQPMCRFLTKLDPDY